jgi:anti-sigma factor RsiW
LAAGVLRPYLLAQTRSSHTPTFGDSWWVARSADFLPCRVPVDRPTHAHATQDAGIVQQLNKFSTPAPVSHSIVRQRSLRPRPVAADKSLGPAVVLLRMRHTFKSIRTFDNGPAKTERPLRTGLFTVALKSSLAGILLVPWAPGRAVPTQAVTRPSQASAKGIATIRRGVQIRAGSVRIGSEQLDPQRTGRVRADPDCKRLHPDDVACPLLIVTDIP